MVQRLSRAHNDIRKCDSRFFIAQRERAGKPNTQAMKHQSEIHIGKIIRAQLKADKRSISWLAREIGCTRNNIYKIFNKPSLDSDLILSISKAMSYNFFKYYSAEIQAAIKERIGED